MAIILLYTEAFTPVALQKFSSNVTAKILLWNNTKNTNKNTVIPTQNQTSNVDKVSIEVSANKGFYVRSLINDLGTMLNTYAVMSNLIRTKAGKYDISISQTLEEIKENGPIIHSIEDTFSHLKRIDVNDYIAINLSLW